MDRIADSLLSDRKAKELYDKDWELVESTGGMLPFVWMITERHSFIYIISAADHTWSTDLLKGMNSTEKVDVEYYLFLYRIVELVPVFPKTIRSYFQIP